MQNFNIVKEIKPSKSFRTEKIISMFDIDLTTYKEKFIGQFELPKKWNIGLIVGRSGTGKSTIAKTLFKINTEPTFDDKSIIDCMPQGKTVEEIAQVFSNVGFSSPPSWLKSYKVLSQGEQMRVKIAYHLLSEDKQIVFDEYTSVVDRDVAKIVSLVIHKEIVKQNKQFIAISCHEDIIEWIQPDWTFNTNEMKFDLIKKKDQTSTSSYIEQKQACGQCFANITI